MRMAFTARKSQRAASAPGNRASGGAPDSTSRASNSPRNGSSHEAKYRGLIVGMQNQCEAAGGLAHVSQVRNPVAGGMLACDQSSLYHERRLGLISGGSRALSQTSPRRAACPGREGKAASLLGAETHATLIATFSARRFRRMTSARIVSCVRFLRNLGHPDAPTDVGAGHSACIMIASASLPRQRLAEAALHFCLAALDSLNPFLCRLRRVGRRRSRRLLRYWR